MNEPKLQKSSSTDWWLFDCETTPTIATAPTSGSVTNEYRRIYADGTYGSWVVHGTSKPVHNCDTAGWHGSILITGSEAWYGLHVKFYKDGTQLLWEAKTTGEFEIPDPPSALTGFPTEGGHVDLEWVNPESANVDNAFELQRRRSTTDWATIVEPTANGDAWTDSTTEQNRRYFYRVRNCAEQCSAWSNTLDITTSGTVDPDDPGQLLTCDQVAALVVRAGIPEADQITMTAIAKQESSFYTAIVSYIGCCVGLWQIHLEVWNTTFEAMSDPINNAEMMFDIYNQQGLDAWEAYTGPDGAGSDGPWLNHVDAVTPCVERQRANGGAAADEIGEMPDLNEKDPVKDPENDSLSCGLSMFCWMKAALKWAFVPNDADDAWDSLYDTASTRPPFSIVIGTVTWADDLIERVQFGYEVGGPASGCFDLNTGQALPGHSGEACFGASFVEMAEENESIVSIIRIGANLMLVLGTIMVVVRIFRTAVSTAPETKAGELTDEPASYSEGNEDDR
jgi:hypothetical protein